MNDHRFRYCHEMIIQYLSDLEYARLYQVSKYWKAFITNKTKYDQFLSVIRWKSNATKCSMAI